MALVGCSSPTNDRATEGTPAGSTATSGTTGTSTGTGSAAAGTGGASGTGSSTTTGTGGTQAGTGGTQTARQGARGAPPRMTQAAGARQKQMGDGNHRPRRRCLRDARRRQVHGRGDGVREVEGRLDHHQRSGGLRSCDPPRTPQETPSIRPPRKGSVTACSSPSTWMSKTSSISSGSTSSYI